jgi:hypothetical protein
MMIRGKTPRWAAAVVAGLIWICAPAEAAAQSCDRTCLEGLMTAYLEALGANDPSSLPLADNVRFTEDTVELSVGEGLWQTATRVRPYRIDIVDVAQSAVGTHTIVEEENQPAMYQVRLGIEGRRIAEIETMVVRGAEEGMLFDVSGLASPSPAMTYMPGDAERDSREEMIEIALHYPAGLRAGSFVEVDAPFASGAYRLENGVRMAGPGCTFGQGCEDIKAQRIPKLAQLTDRVAAVDEEMGIVWLRMDFGPGSVFGRGGDSGTPSSLNVWEMFKVYGGEIHAVEAFMEVMPWGTPSGWD